MEGALSGTVRNYAPCPRWCRFKQHCKHWKPYSSKQQGNERRILMYRIFDLRRLFSHRLRRLHLLPRSAHVCVLFSALDLIPIVPTVSRYRSIVFSLSSYICRDRLIRLMHSLARFQQNEAATPQRPTDRKRTRAGTNERPRHCNDLQIGNVQGQAPMSAQEYE